MYTQPRENLPVRPVGALVALKRAIPSRGTSSRATKYVWAVDALREQHGPGLHLHQRVRGALDDARKRAPLQVDGAVAALNVHGDE
jgi:hypothetical protein